MSVIPVITYFADENLLGMGKLLRNAGRDDVVYPGHDDLRQVPLGMADSDWMPIVAGLGLVVLTRDRGLRTRPVEARIYRESGLRSVWIGGKRDLGPRDQLALFLKYEARLRRAITKLGTGPWALALSPAGVRTVRVQGL